jgi:hypothetical protein
MVWITRLLALHLHNVGLDERRHHAKNVLPSSNISSKNILASIPQDSPRSGLLELPRSATLSLINFNSHRALDRFQGDKLARKQKIPLP